MLQRFTFTASIVASLALFSAAAAEGSVIQFEDSFFDTTSGASAWWLVGLGGSAAPSCLLVPAADPDAQRPSGGNVCTGADRDGSDADGRSFFGDFDIFSSPFEGLVAAAVSEDFAYDPLADGALPAVRVRFQFEHFGSNSGTPLNTLEARALVFQRGAGGEARFFASLGDARVTSRSDATGFAAFDRVLTSSDFGELRTPSFAGIDASSNPDFDAGAPVRLGFVVDMGYADFLGGPPSTPFTVRRFLLDEFAFAVDSDADGVGDFADNCTLEANTLQHDADLDGFGDVCDGDCSQDGLAGGRDFILLSVGAAMGHSCDLTGDGVSDAADFFVLRSRYGRPVGPAAPR